jgi:hypothetical protein
LEWGSNPDCALAGIRAGLPAQHLSRWAADVSTELEFKEGSTRKSLLATIYGVSLQTILRILAAESHLTS